MRKQTTSLTPYLQRLRWRAGLRNGISFLLIFQLVALVGFIQPRHHHTDFQTHDDCSVCSVVDQNNVLHAAPTVSVVAQILECHFLVQPLAVCQGILPTRLARGPPFLT